MGKPINVLSLFDGISCGQQALKELKIPVANYFASEIEVPAMNITHKNFPDTIQLGDVRHIRAKNLPKIDLLTAGSPCQGFSLNGRQLNFEDPRSKLFFEFVRILKELKALNPKIKFLLENVRMKKDYEDTISEILEVPAVFINSSLLSAQSRPRLYWCNWEIKLPEEAGIVVDDILDTPAYKGKTGNFKTDTTRLVNYNRFLEIQDTTKKHQCLMAEGSLKHHYPGIPTGFNTYRDLTINEQEALQTLPRDYTKAPGVSPKSRIMGIGNGWTVAVIKHILKQSKLK